MLTKSIFRVRLVAILSFIIIATTVYSQKQTVTYIGTNGKLTTLTQALYMQKMNVKSAKASIVLTYEIKDSKWQKIGTEHYKKLNDSTWQIKGNGEDFKGIMVRSFNSKNDSSFKFKDLDHAQVVRSGYAKSIVPLFLHSKVTEYYLGGKIKSVSIYNNNELVSNENWNEDGSKYIDNIFYSADSYPFFNPGNTLLHEHIIKGFKDAGIDVSTISGSIKIGFVVMENGSIQGIKVIKGLGPIINSVALDSFTTLLGTWKPAKLNNQTVRYYQVFPINFINKENRLQFAELRGGILHFQTD